VATPAACPTQVVLLGAFGVRPEPSPGELPGTVQRLVALLALHGRPLHRLYVAGTLWPDVSEDHAFASLRSALWRLRTSGCRIVRPTGTHLRIEEHVEIDALELIAAAHRLNPPPDASRAGDLPEDLDALVDRFGDDLLPDWYDDWVVVWRERWRHVRLHALESLAALLGRAGDYGRAVEAGLAAVRAEPLRESAHRALITVHIAEGNGEEALRQYGSYRRLVGDELGIAPSPLMEGLVAGLTAR
jgi:DNA-binding SARP family transcriptional activator